MSWKQYGGKFDKTNNVSTQHIVCDHLTVRQAYLGQFDVSGDFIVSGNTSLQSDTYIQGNLLAYQNCSIQADASIDGNVSVAENVDIAKYLTLGNGSTFLSGSSDFIGINTHSPQSTLDILGSTELTFQVQTNQTNNFNILSQNKNHYGICVQSNDSHSQISFYTQPIYTFSSSSYAGNPHTLGYADGSLSNQSVTFLNPCAISWNSNLSCFYVCDSNTIRCIHISSGTVSTVAGIVGLSGYTDGIFGVGTLNSPLGLVWDPMTQSLFIADTGNHCIRHGVLQNDSGTFTLSTWGSLYLSNPTDLCVDLYGNLFVCDSVDRVVYLLNTRQSSIAICIAGQKSISGQHDGFNSTLIAPTGICVSSQGIVYLFDSGVIRCLTRSPNSTSSTPFYSCTTLAGTLPTLEIPPWKDGMGTEALFSNQGHISCSSHSPTTLWISDSKHDIVRRLCIDVSGVAHVDTLVGNPGNIGYQEGTGIQSLWNLPLGLVDVSGTIFVCDSANYMIRQVVSLIYPSNSNTLANLSLSPSSFIDYQSTYVNGQNLILSPPDTTVIQSKCCIAPNDISVVDPQANTSLTIYPFHSNATNLTLVSSDSNTCAKMNFVGPDSIHDTKFSMAGGNSTSRSLEFSIYKIKTQPISLKSFLSLFKFLI